MVRGYCRRRGVAFRHFIPGFLQFVACPSRGASRLPKVGSSNKQHPPKEQRQMITAFFAFVTVAFFVAVVANVAETVASSRSFA